MNFIRLLGALDFSKPEGLTNRGLLDYCYHQTEETLSFVSRPERDAALISKIALSKRAKKSGDDTFMELELLLLIDFMCRPWRPVCTIARVDSGFADALEVATKTDLLSNVYASGLADQNKSEMPPQAQKVVLLGLPIAEALGFVKARLHSALIVSDQDSSQEALDAGSISTDIRGTPYRAVLWRQS